MTLPASSSGFFALFTPKLLTILRHEPYDGRAFRADAFAGLTVAIVAIPLSMAIAIASHVGPERGLYTAIVGGFLVSLLGGSRFQIGGPAGAFIILVAATFEQYGLEGLLLATLLSGIILLAIGLLRLGAFIHYIPYPVTVGFTAGIAVIIFASQIRPLLGLVLAGKEPGPLVEKLESLVPAMSNLSPSALLVSAITIGVILGVRYWRPHWPSFLIGVVIASVIAALSGLPVATVGSEFPAMPLFLPSPKLPSMSLETILQVLPAASAFALLGSIESLLSAMVADNMSGQRHRSHCELVAQGLANIASALFGGICVTGTIARTATNVRAGARSPISGMIHALCLLLFLPIASQIAGFIPLAALAAVLAVVCWNMAEKHAFAMLLKSSYGDAVVLLVTFLLVIFRDLTEGILVGFGLGALLFLHRMARSVTVERTVTGDVVSFRLSGAFFFGAASAVSRSLEDGVAPQKAHVLDISSLSILDSSAAMAIDSFVRKAQRWSATVLIIGAQPATRSFLESYGICAPRVAFGSMNDAIALMDHAV